MKASNRANKAMNKDFKSYGSFLTSTSKTCYCKR